MGLLSQVIMATMEGNHIGRQDDGGSGGLIEYDIPVSGARNGAHTPYNGAKRHMMRLFPLNTLVEKLWRHDEKWPGYEDLTIFIYSYIHEFWQIKNLLWINPVQNF